MENATATEVSDAAQDACRTPFPEELYMAGARHFPLLVPVYPDDPAVPANQAAWEVLERWTKPVLTLWAPDDPVLGAVQDSLVERIPGATGQPHAQFRPAKHFIQEDQGPALAEAIIARLSRH